jgi:hypothetical protein
VDFPKLPAYSFGMEKSEQLGFGFEKIEEEEATAHLPSSSTLSKGTTRTSLTAS